MTGPNPATSFPLEGIKTLCFLKNIVDLKNVVIGDYTYYDDFENVLNFAQNIRYHFEFTGDRLVIGKFCQIASGVEFIMNGGNHLTSGISTFPFSIFGNGWEHAMDGKTFPNKGDTIIGNDAWIGYKALIMPGIKVGDGAIIATASVVTKDVPPYAIVGGNPARVLKMRFADDDIERLLKIQWWDWSAEKITRNVGLLTSSDTTTLESCT
jgi:virginiamycin A acetyltransferase